MLLPFLGKNWERKPLPAIKQVCIVKNIADATGKLANTWEKSMVNNQANRIFKQVNLFLLRKASPAGNVNPFSWI